MDQLNPYQAPEPLLPTATEVAVTDESGKEPTEELLRGLKFLKNSAILFLLSSAMLGLWDFYISYRNFTEQPLENFFDINSFWLFFLLEGLAEAFSLCGLYWCSTRIVAGVSRGPLLVSLILGAFLFPDTLYYYALQKPWIYFEGNGNAHAHFGLGYLASCSNFASCVWLLLWMTARHDPRNHQRVMLMLFVNTVIVILSVLSHVITVLMLVEHPDNFFGWGSYYLFNGACCLCAILNCIIAWKLFHSLILQITERSAHEIQACS